MEDREIARRLKGFDAVWKRVGAGKSAASPAGGGQSLRLMPGRGKPTGGRRLEPGRR